jgi:hypothetical protein
LNTTCPFHSTANKNLRLIKEWMLYIIHVCLQRNIYLTDVEESMHFSEEELKRDHRQMLMEGDPAAFCVEADNRLRCFLKW